MIILIYVPTLKNLRVGIPMTIYFPDSDSDDNIFRKQRSPPFLAGFQSKTNYSSLSHSSCLRLLASRMCCRFFLSLVFNPRCVSLRVLRVLFLVEKLDRNFSRLAISLLLTPLYDDHKQLKKNQIFYIGITFSFIRSINQTKPHTSIKQ